VQARPSPAKARQESRLTYHLRESATPRALRILTPANVDPANSPGFGEDEVNRIARGSRTKAISKAICAKTFHAHQAVIDIQSYRGLRHRRNLPTRGQRTQTQARTARDSVKAQSQARRSDGEELGAKQEPQKQAAQARQPRTRNSMSARARTFRTDWSHTPPPRASPPPKQHNPPWTPT